MAARQGRGATRHELDVTLRSLAEGIRAVTVLLHPYIPETAAKLLEALGEEDLALDAAAVRRAPGGGTVAKLRSCSRSPSDPRGQLFRHSRSDRQPHPPRLAPRATDAEIVAAARAAGVTRILTIGTERRELAPRAGGRRGARRRLVRRRPPPEQRHRLHRRDHRRAARDRAPPALRGDRRDRAGRLPRLRAARPTRSARSPRTSAWRASSASRSSSTPAPPTTTRSPRSRATRRAST